MTASRSTSEPLIELRDVSLCYRLARQKVGSLKEYFIHLLRGTLSYRQLWALQNVDLEIGRGEVVGVVGRNGAGKSTLAKVIAGVLKPTLGQATVRGTISPILELGTGFDHELTGWENIFLNAMLLGRRKREIEAMTDEIIEFSGLGDFIHSPVRNYSTGMMARLGFAVATAWMPDVLVLDEVLAVGDARFLARCHRRLHRFREAGTTILIVSHSLPEIRRQCSRCLWIDEGLLKADGDPKDILGDYTDDVEVDLAKDGLSARHAERLSTAENGVSSVET